MYTPIYTMSESHEHYTGLISTVEDYLYELGELELKLKELETLLREAREKEAEPVHLEFSYCSEIQRLTEEARFMGDCIFSVLQPD